MGIVGGGYGPERPSALGASRGTMRSCGLTDRGRLRQGAGRGMSADFAVCRGPEQDRLLGGRRARPSAGALRVWKDGLWGETR